MLERMSASGLDYTLSRVELLLLRLNMPNIVVHFSTWILLRTIHVDIIVIKIERRKHDLMSHFLRAQTQNLIYFEPLVQAAAMDFAYKLESLSLC